MTIISFRPPHPNPAWQREGVPPAMPAESTRNSTDEGLPSLRDYPIPLLMIRRSDRALLCGDRAMAALTLTRLFARTSRHVIRPADGKVKQRIDELVDSVMTGQTPSVLLHPLGDRARMVADGYPAGTADDIACGFIMIRELQLAPWSDEDLTEAFDLTRRQAEVALGLLHGMSLDEIARKLGIRMTTARYYLKGVYSKVGVSGRSQLISCLNGQQDQRSSATEQ